MQVIHGAKALGVNALWTCHEHYSGARAQGGNNIIRTMDMPASLSHSFVRNRFFIIYYTTCFKVRILLDHFGSQNNSQNIPLKYDFFSEKYI